MTHFKNCSQNFGLSINMALVNGGFLHYMDMKKFLKNFFLQNRLSDFEIISQECSWCDSFKKLMAKLWSVHKYGSGECGLFALYRHEEIHKKSCSQKPLVRFWNNFTGIRFWHQQTSWLTHSGRNCYRQAALTICEPTRQVKFLVCYHQFGSFSQIPVVFGLWDLISKWILNCLQNSFKKKHQKTWLLWKTHFPLIGYKVKPLKAF